MLDILLITSNKSKMLHKIALVFSIGQSCLIQLLLHENYRMFVLGSYYCNRFVAVKNEMGVIYVRIIEA